MKLRCRSILANAQAAIAAVLLVATAFGQSSSPVVTNAQAAALVKQIENKYGGLAQWDTNGCLIELRLVGPAANNSNLALAGAIDSIRALGVKGGPYRTGGLTREGISSLGGMTNLTEFSVACMFKMPAGMLEEICRLNRLRSLALYGAAPADVAEYKSLGCLTNLEELRIHCCIDFHRQELAALTNLTHLKSLDLDYSGSEADTNILACLKGLTNLNVDFRK